MTKQVNPLQPPTAGGMYRRVHGGKLEPMNLTRQPGVETQPAAPAAPKLEVDANGSQQQ